MHNNRVKKGKHTVMHNNSFEAERMLMTEGYKSNHQGIVHCFIIVDFNVNRCCI